MAHFFTWITLAKMLVLATAVFGTASYRARRRDDAGTSYASSFGAGPVTEYPGGTLKRTAYTGRFCAYTKTKMVPHRVPNGTESYLKQVRTKCSWSAVYCTPRVNFVRSTRLTYKTVMKKKTTEVWTCCPGFEGENCDNTCYNCTTINDLKDRVAALEEQMISGSPQVQTSETGNSPPKPGRGRKRGQKGEPGPVGPRGPSGEDGATGPRGPIGTSGEKGVSGVPGLQGEVGPRGPMGAKGHKGEPGQKGKPGLAGPAGIDGLDGSDGVTGHPGPRGEKGDIGVSIKGPKGDAGETGRDGQTGLPGQTGPRGLRGADGTPGIKGEVGPPGPPGECGCQRVETPTATQATTVVKETTAGSLGCFYGRKYRTEDEMWTNENCEQCFCINGSVSCLAITCPNVTCAHKYKPEGYCCEICCRYQGGLDEFVLPSGDGEYETMINSEYEYPFFTNVSETMTDYTPSYPDEVPLDKYGCPMPPQNDDTQPMETTVVDRCLLRKDRGPCSRRYQRYYYDKVQQACRLFTYGGCEGNANSFLTLQECQNACTNQSAPSGSVGNLQDSACEDVVADKGTCKMTLFRFTYDRGTGRCHSYLFNGCGSSSNIFDNPDQCQATCNAGNPVYPGFVTQGGRLSDEPPPPPSNIIEEPAMKSGSTRCYQPKYIGRCNAKVGRFYYDVEEGRCKLYIYGGCGGQGGNMFTTPWECRETCGGGDPVYFDDEYRCSVPHNPGLCRGSYRRYYYDKNTRRCEEFAWGACPSSKPENRFETEEECNQICLGTGIQSRSISSPVEQCLEPPHHGPCKAHLYRFYYDPITERCSTFVYGGCNKNRNNFVNPEECVSTCGGQSVNYTVTEFQPAPQDNGQSGGSQRGERGPPGPPGRGIKGDAGPPGPRGPKGDSASLEQYAAEIKFLKNQLDELAAMVLGHVSDMEKHVQPAPPEEEASDFPDGDFTLPPIEFFPTYEGGSK